MLCGRIANTQAPEVAKLSVRGSVANGAAKWATVKSGQPMPVWYVFSGAEIGALSPRPASNHQAWQEAQAAFP